MPAVNEIETAREQAVRDLDLQVIEAISRRNASSSQATRSKLDTVINGVMLQRTRLNAAAVKEEDDSDEMKDALQKLHDATLVLTRTAEHEKTLADFLTVATAFVGAAGKLAGALG